jgi:hypothetical protein
MCVKALEVAFARVTDSAQSAWQVAVKRRLVRNVTNGEVIPFAVASATVMALFDQGSESAVTGLTRRLLKAVGGEHQ